MRKKLRSLFSDQSGTVIVVTAVSLFMIIGVACVAMDLGHLYVAKSELQRAADAAAISGARALFPFPLPTDFSTLTPNCSFAVTEAKRVAASNPVDGIAPAAADVTVQTGFWDFTANTFTPGCPSPSPNFTNAAQVRVTRNSIPLIFFGLLNFGGTGSGVGLSASATAAKGFLGSFPLFPLALWVGAYPTNTPSTLQIFINSDKNDIGDWAMPSPQNPSGNALKTALSNYPNNAPIVSVNNILELGNGSDASLQNPINALHGQIVFLPVVDTSKFVQQAPILGFAPFLVDKMDHVKGGKGENWFISGTILGPMEVPGNIGGPGGGNFGLLTSSRLVQ